MEKNIYPKILIVGYAFDTGTGGGITMTNLFRDWPRERLAVATEKPGSYSTVVCDRYYRFGYAENRRPWPFSLFQKKQPSGPVHLPSDQGSQTVHPRLVEKKHSFLKKFLLYLRHFFGIYPLIYRLRISDAFMEWTKAFEPDIIYSQLSKLSINRFVLDLKKKTGLPLAVHIMDDWPKTLKEPGLLQLYWKSYTDRNFRHILRSSKLRMSICQAMSDEYFRRYGHEFIPFHNTVDLSEWEKLSREDWKKGDIFRILYAGRIGRGTNHSILKIIRVVEKLGLDGFGIQLELQTRILPDEMKEEVSRCRHVIHSDYIAYEDLPAKFAQADLLLLPMDFDSYNLEFIHLSMPTKVPEYMASGTPVLVFAARSTALNMYAAREGWAYVVPEDNAEMLGEAITKLYQDEGLRKQIAMQAKSVVEKNHDSQKVRAKFRESFQNAIYRP